MSSKDTVSVSFDVSTTRFSFDPETLVVSMSEEIFWVRKPSSGAGWKFHGITIQAQSGHRTSTAAFGTAYVHDGTIHVYDSDTIFTGTKDLFDYTIWVKDEDTDEVFESDPQILNKEY